MGISRGEGEAPIPWCPPQYTFPDQEQGFRQDLASFPHFWWNQQTSVFPFFFSFGRGGAEAEGRWRMARTSE